LHIYATPDSGKRRIFRGQAIASKPLLPSIARFKTSKGKEYNEDDEYLLFRMFKQRAASFLDRSYDDLSIWVLAQHYGLPTRLMDWSYNPLIAAYFATEHQANKDEEKETSAIFIFEDYPEPAIGEHFDIKVSELKSFAPAHLDIRVVNQRGLFTVHPYPWKPLQDSRIICVVIAADYRRSLRKQLNLLGVNESVIYPGLDGLSKHLKWMKTDAW
jgi:hypothetical protein